MFYTIYETINTVNGKKYIGKHVTQNPQDSYLGSGLLLKKAIDKYGREKFTKKVLYVFDNESEMNAMEIELVNEDVVLSEEYYNIALGGAGGRISLYEKNPKYKKICNKISESTKKHSKTRSKNAKKNHVEKKIGMYGRKHKDETKKKISEGNIGKEVSDQTRKRLSDSNRGREPPNKGKRMVDLIGHERATEIFSAQSKRNAERYSGEGNPMYGKNHREETKEKIRQRAINRKRIRCQHCDKYFAPGTYSRWHNNNCKKRLL